MDNSKVEQRRAFIINAAYFGVVLVLVLLIFRYLIPWLLPFIIGYLIAMIFKPVVRFVVKHTPLGPKFTGCVVLLLAYGLIVLLLAWGGAKLFGQLQALFSNLMPYYNETLQPALSGAYEFVRQWLGSLNPEFALQGGDFFDSMLGSLQGFVFDLSTSALGALGSLTTKIPGFLLAFFFSIMSSLIISMNYQDIANFLTKQVPERHRELVFAVKNSAIRSVGLYIIAYFKLMCVTFVELSIGLSVLRVENPFLIALGIAAFDFLPVLGTGGVMIPWVVITLLNAQVPLALGLLILYAIITVVRNIIEPRIVGNQLGLHPLVALIAIYIGFKLMGVLGMIVFPILFQLAAHLHHSGAVKIWES